MRVRIIAADSMGVRSLATQVEMCSVKVGLDLGASLAPTRFGLPPHPLETDRLRELRGEALRALESSEVVTITHYHYDHYMRDHPGSYEGKILLVKHPLKDINSSQRSRARFFLEKSGVAETARVIYADGETIELGDLRIQFSPPVWHGEPGTRVGKVLMVRLQCGDETLIFTSDVQGPADAAALEVLRRWRTPRPKLVILGGPPTYFAGYKVPVQAVKQGLEGMLEIIRTLKPETLIADHHLVRDPKYRERIRQHVEEAERLGVRLVTAAEYMGREPEPLEAFRKRLWKGNPFKA